MELLFDFPTPTGRPVRFSGASSVVAAYRPGEVGPALREIHEATRKGYYAAGYLAYEAASALNPSLVTRPAGRLPLLCFGLFREPGEAPDRAARAAEAPRGAISAQRGPQQTGRREPTCAAHPGSDWRPSISRESYRDSIAVIRSAIARGETYQVNHTFRLRRQFDEDPASVYSNMKRAQGARYCAFLDFDGHCVLSASPELFFHWAGGRIVTRPMKGTAPRGRWAEEDRAQSTRLAASEKNRAENLMIVDLMRNDLGRIAEPGSVRASELFAIEPYPTLFQMTSTIEATTRPELSLEEVLAALFPAGSVTGAPKASTMRLIAALEDSPRGIYCGAVGLLSPGGEALFNVAIRTAVVDREARTVEYGVGGGITWDSSAEDEYGEAMLKARILTEETPDFSLLETMRLEDGSYSLLDRHLRRLEESASYFAIPVRRQMILGELERLARERGIGSHRVRLLVSSIGGVSVESAPIEPPSAKALRARLASSPISSINRFLFHKTTRREVYDRHRAAHPDVFDVLLWNERGELTEFTVGNLVLETNGVRWTPPVACGLLGGTLRAELLEQGVLKERVLTRDDLKGASRIWLINSVRGWVAIELVE